MKITSRAERSITESGIPVRLVRTSSSLTVTRSTSGRYRHVAERLAAANLSVWAPDHRGHGNSAGERGNVGSFDGVVSDLDRVVDIASKRGAGLPIFLVGHSLGGAIALAYALAHQDRLAGLSLSAPAICISPKQKRHPAAARDGEGLPELVGALVS